GRISSRYEEGSIQNLPNSRLAEDAAQRMLMGASVCQHLGGLEPRHIGRIGSARTDAIPMDVEHHPLSAHRVAVKDALQHLNDEPTRCKIVIQHFSLDHRRSSGGGLFAPGRWRLAPAETMIIDDTMTDVVDRIQSRHSGLAQELADWFGQHLHQDAGTV